jgi:hypothetical protein
LRLAGDSIFVQEYLFRLVPELKAYGKYKADHSRPCFRQLCP